MKTSLSMKTLLRAPVRTVLTFVLLGVVTFALFSQAAEYAITVREMAAAAGQYTGVGSAEAAQARDVNSGSPGYIDADPRMAPRHSEKERAYYLDALRYKPLTREQIDAAARLPAVTSVHTRYMTAGVSDDLYRPDEGGYFYNYTTRAVIEGTLAEVKYGGAYGTGGMNEDGEFYTFNLMVFDDCAVLSDTPWLEEHYESLSVTAHPMKIDARQGMGTGLQRWPLLYTPDYIYDTAYLEAMTPGSRYVFIARFDPLLAAQGPDLQDSPRQEFTLFLSDHLSEPRCPSIWPVGGALGDYLQAEVYAPLRELIEITNADAHTLDVVYTDDMGAILRFAEGKMAITDGRALTGEDSREGAMVCVVSRELAMENGLAVGDTVTVRLGGALFEQYKGLGAVAGARERYKPAEKPVALQIVGVYADTEGVGTQAKTPNWCYSAGTVFVPESLLPVDKSQLDGHVFSPAEWSFKVENAWDIPAFIEEAEPMLEGMGLTLVFYDDGWIDIADGFQAAEKLSLIRIALLAAAAAAAIWFAVYLFIGRKKKEYAIMRALGTPGPASARALLIPLLAVTAAAVLAGGGAAWMYTVKTVARSSALSMLEGYSARVSVPAAAAAGCMLGEILLTLVIALVLLRQIGGRPPLALLQEGGQGQIKAAGKKPVSGAAAVVAARVPALPAASSSISPAATPLPPLGPRPENPGIPEPARPAGKGGGAGFVLGYILRHARRAAGKSALALLLAALLFAAVGQFALMRRSYIALCENTVVTARFVGGIQLSVVPQLLRTGYGTDMYYEGAETVGLGVHPQQVIITNDIGRYTGEEADITYADGYDATAMDALGKILIAGEGVMAAYGLEPGDTVTVITPHILLTQVRDYIAKYRESHPEAADEDILTSQRDRIIRAAGVRTDTFTVAGVVSTPSGAYSMEVFAPGSGDALGLLNTSTRLQVAEFKLADYRLVEDLRSYGENMTSWSANTSFIMDASKLEGPVKTLRLLDALYPAALAAALLIGGFLCALVIFQSSREAAIMRIQGTTKGRARAMLALEQALLSAAGLVVGAVGLLVYKGAALSAVSEPLIVFAGLYFAVILAAATTCAGLATRRNVLELLQTKE